MNIGQAFILGIVEGTTEYLPISSTFHLIWTSKLLGLSQTDFQKMFEVVIQSGAILAVLTLYLKTLTTNWELLKKLSVSFIPTTVIGFLLYKTIKGVFFESYLGQILIFIFIGLLFIILEKLWQKKKFDKTLDQVTYPEAAIIGLAQALAVFPGVSRAGAVILALMFFKVRRDEAAKYSFLLAVPTLIAASALDLLKSKAFIFTQSENIILLLVGLVVSFISALIVVRWFVTFLQKHKLTFFGWYRLLVGIILIICLTMKIF